MVPEVAEEEKDIKIYLIYHIHKGLNGNPCLDGSLEGHMPTKLPRCKPQMGDVTFKHLRGPSVLADQLNKTAPAQIDRLDAGAGLFNT